MDRQVKPRLSAVEGVAGVAAQGGALVGIAVAVSTGAVCGSSGSRRPTLLQALDRARAVQSLGVEHIGADRTTRSASRCAGRGGRPGRPAGAGGRRSACTAQYPRHDPPRGRQRGPVLPDEWPARRDDAGRAATRCRRDQDGGARASGTRGDPAQAARGGPVPGRGRRERSARRAVGRLGPSRRNRLSRRYSACL